ncbi:hypothetical protein ZIOFF_050641 [Zingiber officinale]|uniref:Glycosyltransferase 61 catalytic domain-containing protein n=1 Tax=Zingiber officinale TaxID=94328 RepID=A0A8J5FHD4_ZINOF|nr:hypothetical protein ZIOFF_050641 [Zingiber officinale]
MKGCNSMKPSDHHNLFSHLRPSRKLNHVALFGCLLITLLLVCLMKSSSSTMVTLSMQLSSYENVSLPMVRESGVVQQDADLTTKETSTITEEEKTKESASSNQTVSLQLEFDQNEDGDDSNTIAGSILSSSPPDSNEKEEEEPTESNGEIPRKESRVMCDFTAPRSDTCQIDGDVRVVPKSSTILLASPLTRPSQNTTWKIRPYPRKWEHATMEPIKELTISLATATAADYQRRQPPPPRCTVTHAVPAAFFSTGGFVGNYFHDFTDVIIPLFMTVRRFHGEVRFLVSDFNYPFMAKYRPILERLSNHPPINLDAGDGEVHCFPQAHVGLFSHRALGIDATKSPDGVSMRDFRDFLRSCFSLKLRSISRGISRGKPRLLLILRRGSRSFVNEREVMRMVKSVGFKLITAGPEEAQNISRFAQLVNSVDVLMGIHGAGLTNMVFLPANATVVQIIPCCQLADGCRYIFAEPAPAMGLKYAEYEIKVEESTLWEKYPRDHVVFRDPISIQKKQGFNAFWNIFLNHQKVKLDVGRAFSTPTVPHPQYIAAASSALAGRPMTPSPLRGIAVPPQH